MTKDSEQDEPSAELSELPPGEEDDEHGDDWKPLPIPGANDGDK